MSIRIEQNRLYKHKVLRVHYTTYDMRRDTDTINVQNHADIMVLSQEDDDGSGDSHPYWYARVIGIFHLHARYSGPRSTATDFVSTEILWVRWFGRDMSKSK